MSAKGYMLQQNGEKTKRAAIILRYRSNTQPNDQLQALLASPRASLSMAKGATTTLRKSKVPNWSFERRMHGLWRHAAGLNPPRERSPASRVKCRPTKTDLVMQKLRREGKVNKAPAKVHAEDNQKTMSSNTPRSGSRSHDI